MENETYAHKLCRGTTLKKYQVSKKAMTLKNQQIDDGDNILTRIMIFCQEMSGSVMFLSSTISPWEWSRLCFMNEISSRVELWIFETVEVIRILTETFYKEENLSVPQPFQHAGSVSMFPIDNKVGSITVQLILWSCFSQACHNSIIKCLNDAREGNNAFPQHSNSASKGMLWNWLQSYAFCIKTSVLYSCKYILAKVNEHGEKWALLGKQFFTTILLEVCIISGIISRSSGFFTMIGTNAQSLDCLSSHKSRPQSSSQQDNMAVAATKQFLCYLKTRPKVTFLPPLRQMIDLREIPIQTHVTCDILTMMLGHKDILTHIKNKNMTSVLRGDEHIASGLVQGIVEFHQDESICERACSGEPRSMDAKANYPENRKPSWECGSKLGMSKEVGGELSRGDEHIASGLVQGIVEFHRDESICERACSGEPRTMDAKANYTKDCKPRWECGSKLGKSKEVGGELSRVNDSCVIKVRDDGKCQFKPSMSVAMASGGGCLTSRSHSVNAKERARSAAQTLRNKDLKKTHYCHVYKSTAKKSRCSHRSQAASIYSTVVDEVPLSKDRWRRKQKRRNKKQMKQKESLIPVFIPGKLATHIHMWSDMELKGITLVFDGGVDGNSPISAPADMTWTSLRINDGELYVVDTMDDSKGLIYPVSHGVSPFMRLPRKAALSITKMDDIKENKRFCTALHSGAQAQRGPLKRGKSKLVFTDGKFADKYGCIGVQVNRGSKGVRGESYHADKMPVKDWNVIVEMIRRVEKAFRSFANTEDIQHIERVSELLQFQTMGAKTSTKEPIFADIYQGVAFGENVFLECHVDEDFARSIVMVQMDDHQCGPKDRVVAYFCFPRLGIAVALRPGDLLIFNALEPHAISSRCHKSDKLLCVSMYLKTAVVGLNNNDIKLTEKQEEMMGIYRKQNK